VGRAAHVTFNESDPHALRGLALGLEVRQQAPRSGARSEPQASEVAAGRAVDRLDALADADVVIVDPPRRGLDPELVDALRARRPTRLVYVSCDLDSLERDVARLGWRPAALEAWNLFPFTEHVEALVVFDPSRA
jgi:tRNA/tmRNA/rRNA uracil-C5-methylase (TrmA/RlmC/RlmD family)